MPAWSRASLAVALVAFLLTVGPAMATTVAPPPATAADGSTSTVETAVGFESNTTYQIDMRANGNADWSLAVSFPLANDSQREGFDVVADRFEQGEFLSVTAFEEVSSRISDTTGRPMRITDVTRSVNTTANRGRLVLTFTWTNFGYRQGDQLFVDDVFRTDDRLLSGLATDETLILTRPDGYQFNSASTNIQDGVLRWDGPYTFGANEPYVSFTPIPPPDTPSNGDAEGTGTMLYAVGGIVLVGALAAVAYVVRRQDGPLLPADESTEDETPTAPEQPDHEPATETDIEETTAEETATGADEAAERDASADDQSEDAADEEPVDVELLSDEERVERLLEANGGRMKQANIVTETGWSNAKVSQLLSAMDEDGRIEKLRIGRENLISFPDEESDDADV